MNPEDNFTAFQDGVFSSIMSSVQTSGRIAAEDVSFQRTSNPNFNAALDETSTRILDLANQLLKSASRGSDLAAPKMTDIDDLDTKWSDTVEIVDFLLEKADTCLDEYTGAIKHKNPEPLPGALLNMPQRNNGRVQKASSWKSRQMAKPQLKFEGEINNFDASPFKPIIRTKPHAIVPLEDSIRLEPNEQGVNQYTHPYQTEIETMTHPLRLYTNMEPIMYKPFEETTAIWVDTKEALDEMISELKQAEEIAVDLEHHDTRSYIGFTCLMQISTRDKDWIIDTLSLRLELQALNEVFANPQITKVLHGCYMDVKWLQRDFGLYLVGLFDTHFAAKVLGLPGLGLAYLLKRYVDFFADKQYQLADWRIRPLTPEMFDYARSDTHFLLYIFDCVRNELVDISDPTKPEEDRIEHVLQDSREASLKRYEREAYDAENGMGPGGWYAMLSRGHLSSAEEHVFKAVHKWRDTSAREEDEGIHYTLPKHQMTNLARQMPTDVDTLLRICTPTSPIVRARASELVALIREAKENPPIDAPDETEHASSPVPVAPVLPVAPVMPTVETHTQMAPKNSTFNPKYALTNVFESEPIFIPEIHAGKSTFWGGSLGSSKWEAVRTSKANVNEDVKLAIPLPQLTAAVFVTAEEQSTSVQKTVDPGARAEHEYVKAADRQRRKEEEDIIVVKSLGGAKKKRKFEEDVDQESHQPSAPAQPETQYMEDFQGTTPDDSGDSQAHKRNKKEKKHRAQEEDDDEVRGDTDDEDDKSFKPFDYSKAPPVYNTHKQQKAGGKDGKQQKQPKKVFDPYSKSGDAPRGMSRGQRERSGKSHTFKQ